jgi:hypothetical protein
MNLNNQPTTEQLAHLFASRKDSLDSHILWVCESGEVRIDCLEAVTAEREFEQRHPSMRARFKMYRRGQGYVGKKAAADKDYVSRVLQTLKHEWNTTQGTAVVHVIERFC